MTQRTTPPFRADMVGSLLRTAPLKEARAKFAKGEIAADALKAVEDREIEKIIKKQAEVGLKLATDGEFRRSWWHFDFFRGLPGVTPITTSTGIKFHGVETKHEAIKITGKVDFTGHPMIEHFKFLKAHCNVTPKMTIPAPSTFHFRQGRAMVSKEAYPDYDAFFADIAITWRKAIRAFYDAGCRYLQLDDTAWAMMCDPKEREQSKARGDDPDTLPAIYARVTNAALEGKPADMAITMHSCRGNFRSTFIASGGYEFVAEHLLGTPISTAISWNTTATAPAASSRCASFPRARSNWCSAWSPARAGGWSHGRDQAPHRGGHQIYRARPTLPVAAMRLRLDRGRQRAGRGRAVGQAADDRGNRRRGMGKMSARTAPPFRADHVGSLLRTAPLKEARAKRENGEITADALKAVEDREIEKIIRTPGRCRPESRHRRRIPPRVLELRFPGRALRRRGLSRRAQDQVRRARNPKPMMLRVTGKLGTFAGHPMLEHFKFVKAHTRVTPKMTIPVAVLAAFPLRPRRRAGIDLSGHGRILSRPRADLPQGGARLRRRRLPLSAARRGQFHLSVRPETARAGRRSRRRSRKAAGNLRPHDQRRDLRHSVRHDHRHASVPRQFPARPSSPPAATSRWRRSCSTRSTCTAISWNTTATAPAASSRCASCPRARRSCSVWSPRSPGRLEIEGRAQAPHRSGGEIRAARPALPVAAMRLRLDRGRQYPGRGRAVGEAAR